MVHIGWDERIYPATKIAIAVEALGLEGIPATDALRRTGLMAEQLQTAATLVSQAQVVEVYRNAMHLSRNPRFAFETGCRLHLTAYGMYGFALLSTVEARRAMQLAERYHPLATPVTRIAFSETGTQAVWTIEPLPHPAIDARLYRFIVEMQFGIHLALHRDFMGPDFNLSELHLRFEPPRPDDELAVAARCPVTYRQPGNRLVFDARWLDRTPVMGSEIAH